MDLVCRNRFDGAFFHQLHDCIMPHICEIDSLERSSGSACYDSWQDRWIRILAPHSKRVARGCQRPSPRASCNTYETLQRLVNAKVAPSSDTVVLLKRSGTRSFDEFDKIRDALQHVGPVVVYTGNEPARRTMDLFQNAKYLVGYHGAGLVNAVFMRNHTKILEISTYQNLNNTVPWRSNLPSVTRWGTYVTRVLRLPLEQVLSANKAPYRVKDPDHYIKYLKRVRLTDADLREIVAFGNAS